MMDSRLSNEYKLFEIDVSVRGDRFQATRYGRSSEMVTIQLQLDGYIVYSVKEIEEVTA
jgi:hypothetical protein